MNWPKAKRSRPGPFTCNQSTFQNEVLKRGAKKFSAKLRFASAWSGPCTFDAGTVSLYKQNRGGPIGPPLFRFITFQDTAGRPVSGPYEKEEIASRFAVGAAHWAARFPWIGGRPKGLPYPNSEGVLKTRRRGDNSPYQGELSSAARQRG